MKYLFSLSLIVLILTIGCQSTNTSKTLEYNTQMITELQSQIDMLKEENEKLHDEINVLKSTPSPQIDAEEAVGNKVHPLIGEWEIIFMSIYEEVDNSTIGLRYIFTDDGKVEALSSTGGIIETEEWKALTQEDNDSIVEGTFNWSLYGTFVTWNFVITDDGNSATLTWITGGKEAWKYILSKK